MRTVGRIGFSLERTSVFARSRGTPAAVRAIYRSVKPSFDMRPHYCTRLSGTFRFAARPRRIIAAGRSRARRPERSTSRRSDPLDGSSVLSRRDARPQERILGACAWPLVTASLTVPSASCPVPVAWLLFTFGPGVGSGRWLTRDLGSAAPADRRARRRQRGHAGPDRPARPRARRRAFPYLAAALAGAASRRGRPGAGAQLPATRGDVSPARRWWRWRSGLAPSCSGIVWT